MKQSITEGIYIQCAVPKIRKLKPYINTVQLGNKYATDINIKRNKKIKMLTIKNSNDLSNAHLKM